MKLKFAWDTPERIFWIVSNLLIIVFCILTGIIAETWYLSVLFFLFGAAFFVFLMINDRARLGRQRCQGTPAKRRLIIYNYYQIPY